MFKATAADPKDAGGAASTEGLSGKQVKKQARALARKAIFVEGAEQIIRLRVPKEHIMKAYYSEELDALVALTPPLPTLPLLSPMGEFSPGVIR